MGGCVSSPKDPKTEILKKAHSLFSKLDVDKSGQIKMSDIQKHFGSYSEASAKIMLREIDLDKDSIITYKEWMGYWELVRRSGYTHIQILRQLTNIEDGSLTLNFPNTRNYQQDLPRSTVVSELYKDLIRSPPENLPFSLEE